MDLNIYLMILSNRKLFAELVIMLQEVICCELRHQDCIGMENGAEEVNSKPNSCIPRGVTWWCGGLGE